MILVRPPRPLPGSASPSLVQPSALVPHAPFAITCSVPLTLIPNSFSYGVAIVLNICSDCVPVCATGLWQLLAAKFLSPYCRFCFATGGRDIPFLSVLDSFSITYNGSASKHRLSL